MTTSTYCRLNNSAYLVVELHACHVQTVEDSGTKCTVCKILSHHSH